jgi:arabinan endo-1,5-alpha-L-arabinosidase
MKSFFVSAILIVSFSALAHELVMDHDFPDPSLIKANDGYYYSYATQGYTEEATPRLLNLQVARSRDLKNWQHLGEALPVKPTWAQRTQRFWAPHIHFANNLYYLFYSAEPDTDEGKCLAIAVSTNPQGPFVDSGKPLTCGVSYSNIDPMVYNDPVSKKTLLYWGSAFEPIRVRAISSSLINFASGSTTIPLLAPDRSPNPAPYTKLFEGAWILKNKGFYYLFVSGEDCCGQPNPQYAVLVLRSKNAMGPFEWKNGDPKQSIVIESSGKFTATGHNAFITDPQGQLWTYYHGVDAGHPFLNTMIPGDRVNRRILLRSKIDFVNGWPIAH